MLAIINRILDWFKSLFWKEEMELTLVGLQYSGKTTFVNVIAVSIYAKTNYFEAYYCDYHQTTTINDKNLVGICPLCLYDKDPILSDSS